MLRRFYLPNNHRFYAHVLGWHVSPHPMDSSYKVFLWVVNMSLTNEAAVQVTGMVKVV